MKTLMIKQRVVENLRNAQHDRSRLYLLGRSSKGTICGYELIATGTGSGCTYMPQHGTGEITAAYSKLYKRGFIPVAFGHIISKEVLYSFRLNYGNISWSFRLFGPLPENQSNVPIIQIYGNEPVHAIILPPPQYIVSHIPIKIKS